MTKKESIIILFSITLCWSCAYIFIKDIPAEFSIYAYLTLTSGVAGLILLFMLHKRLKSIDRLTFVRGLIETSSNPQQSWGDQRTQGAINVVL